MEEVVLELTNQCVRKCLHCSTRANEGEEHNLDMDTIIFIMETYKPKWVNISGGEPCLREDLDDIIKIIKSYGAKVRLYTTQFYTGFQKIDEICISIYSLDNTANHYITQTKYYPMHLLGRYTSICIDPTIHIVATTANIAEIPDLVAYLSSVLELPKIKILKLVEQGRCLEHTDLVPTDKQLIALHKKLKSYDNVIFGLPFQHECTAGVEKIVVMSNGIVIPCESFKDGTCKCKKLII